MQENPPMRLRSLSAVIAVFSIIILSSSAVGATEIQLTDRGGIFTLPLKINGATTLEFMVDTGTPEVVVPDDIAATLIQSGAIKDSDFLPGTPYKMADGSVLKSSEFNIREVEIAGMRVNNVKCSIDSQVPELVAGESLLNRFETWELDNARHVLTLGNVKSLVASPKDLTSSPPPNVVKLPSSPPSGQQASQQQIKVQQPPVIDLKKNQFGSFHYNYRKKSQENIYDFQLMAGNRQIFADESYLQIPQLRVFKNVPSPSCQSAITSIYSGGAHCCTTAIILTICGAHEKAFSVDLSSSGVEQLQLLDLNKDGNPQISILDFSFAYYSASDSLSLSFASSPIPRRLLIFDGTRWKSDSKGMFPQFYATMLQKADNDMRKLKKGSDYEQEHLAYAIMRTFYSIMAGKPENDCQNILTNDLPRSWKGVRGKIYSDIKKAITEYDPVKVLE
jgi:hypothetical protein